MTLPARKAREIVLQILYSHDFSDVDSPSAPDLLSESLDMPRAGVRASHTRALAIQKHIPELDQVIRGAASGYAFDRIGRIERNVLRLATFELLYEPTIPPKVVFSEACRLSRKYSTPESAKFVNGVLDVIYKQHIGEEKGEEDKMELYWGNEDPKE